jgi:predicted enzyme related to lactoylglutathione lyase
MLTSPQVRALNLAAPNIEKVAAFYARLLPDTSLSEGEFAGIRYQALIGQGGEVAVCVFQQTEGVPLAPSFPTLMVESVSSYLSEVIDLDGRVLLPESPCPCTGAPFAICEDGFGNQFMVKQPRQAP